jgi:hypothetical protein
MQTEMVASLCRRVGWKVSFISDPSKRFKFYNNGYSEVSQPDALAEFGALGRIDIHRIHMRAAAICKNARK